MSEDEKEKLKKLNEKLDEKALAWKREQERKAEENAKKVNLRIEVDSSAMKEMAQENAELRQHVLSGEKSVNEKLGQQVKEELIKKYEELGLACPKLETEEDMTNAVEIYKRLHDKHRFPTETPSGSAPLSGQYENQEAKKRGYETYEDMINDLHDRENSPDPKTANEAKELLNQLMQKMILKIHKEGDRPVPTYEEKSPALKQENGLLVRADSEDDPFDRKKKFRARRKNQKGES